MRAAPRCPEAASGLCAGGYAALRDDGRPGMGRGQNSKRMLIAQPNCPFVVVST